MCVQFYFDVWTSTRTARATRYFKKSHTQTRSPPEKPNLSRYVMCMCLRRATPYMAFMCVYSWVWVNNSTNRDIIAAGDSVYFLFTLSLSLSPVAIPVYLCACESKVFCVLNFVWYARV